MMLPDMDDADRLYVDTLIAMKDPRDRMRFRELVYDLMREKGGINCWDEVVIEAVASSKTWISAKERDEILAKIEAGNDEYEEAIASQEAAAEIPSR